MQKHRKTIARVAHLAKGIYSKDDSQKAWFYGLFLDGQPFNKANINEIKTKVSKVMHWCTYSDVYNQTVLFFLEVADKYQMKKTSTPFRRYIRMGLGLKLQNWVAKYVKENKERGISSEVWAEDFYMTDVYPAVIEPFRMNIAWVLNGSRGPAFKALKPYERYILYLYFVDGHTIRKIAEMTYKSKNTINKDINCALAVCREGLLTEGQ